MMRQKTITILRLTPCFLVTSEPERDDQLRQHVVRRDATCRCSVWRGHDCSGGRGGGWSAGAGGSVRSHHRRLLQMSPKPQYQAVNLRAHSLTTSSVFTKITLH